MTEHNFLRWSPVWGEVKPWAWYLTAGQRQPCQTSRAQSAQAPLGCVAGGDALLKKSLPHPGAGLWPSLNGLGAINSSQIGLLRNTKGRKLLLIQECLPAWVLTSRAYASTTPRRALQPPAAQLGIQVFEPANYLRQTKTAPCTFRPELTKRRTTTPCSPKPLAALRARHDATCPRYRPDPGKALQGAGRASQSQLCNRGQGHACAGPAVSGRCALGAWLSRLRPLLNRNGVTRGLAHAVHPQQTLGRQVRQVTRGAGFGGASDLAIFVRGHPA